MENNESKQVVAEVKEKKKMGNLTFALIFIAAVVVLFLILNVITKGVFLDPFNMKLILSHSIYPTFVAWALCFLFACGYTDMSLGGVLVLGSFGSCVLGNMYGYVGVIFGGLVIGLILVFINFNIFAFTGIPSWIAGISLGLIYEAIGVILKMNKTTGKLVDTDLNADYRALGQLPLSLIIMLIAMVIIYFLYNRTTIGLNIRAMGGNKDVAKAMGINIVKTLIAVGFICGIIIGVACIIQQSTNVRTTVKTGLTSMNMVFQPIAVVLLAQILQRKINITIAVPICSFFLYAIFNLLTILRVPAGTLQDTCLGAFLIIFGLIGNWGYRGVVK